MQRENPAPAQVQPLPYPTEDASGTTPMQGQAQLQNSVPGQSQPLPYPSADSSGMAPMEGQAQPQPQQYPPGYATGAYPMDAYQQQQQQYQPGYATGGSPTFSHPQPYTPIGAQEVAQPYPMPAYQQPQHQPGYATGVVPNQVNQQQYAPSYSAGDPLMSPYPYQQQQQYPTGYATGSAPMLNPQRNQPVGVRKTGQPNVGQMGPPEKQDYTWIIVPGVIFASLRIIVFLAAIVLAALEVDRDHDPVRKLVSFESYLILAVASLLILFEMGVIIGFLREIRTLVRITVIVFAIGICLCFLFMGAGIMFALSAKEAIGDEGVAELTKSMLRDIRRDMPAGIALERSGTGLLEYSVRKRDEMQQSLKCCGVFGPGDYTGKYRNRPRPTTDVLADVKQVLNKKSDTIPSSCRDKKQGIYDEGCQLKIASRYYHVKLFEAVIGGIMSALFIGGIVISSIALCDP